MRILFLGNAYNPVSIACLHALLESGVGTVVVGIHDPKGRSPLRTAARALKRYGARFVLKRTGDLLAATARIALRRRGASLQGFRSIPELLLVHPAPSVACEDIGAPVGWERIRAQAPDLIVVAAFSRILKPELIEVPRLGCINLHPSLLPRHRGPNPMYWVLAKGEDRTGVTLHHIDAGIDTGDIIAQEKLRILPGETESSLRDRSATLGARMLVEVVRAIESGTATRRPQDASQASYDPHPPRGKSRL